MYGARGQLDEWTMESRIRFGLVWGSFNALIFIALLAAFGDLSVSLAAAALVISVLA